MQPTQIIATALVKKALDESDIEKLVPGGNTASGIFNMPGEQRRAGRARGIAESLGNEVPLAVDHPMTHMALYGIPLSVAGGLAGRALGDKYFGISEAPLVQLAGTMLGGLGGGALAYHLRRKAMERVKEKAVQDLAEGKVPDGNLQPGNVLASLISGVHQQGRADAAEAIRTGKTDFEGNPVMTGLAAGSYVPGVSYLTSLPHAAGSAVNFQRAKKRLAAD